MKYIDMFNGVEYSQFTPELIENVLNNCGGYLLALPDGKGKPTKKVKASETHEYYMDFSNNDKNPDELVDVYDPEGWADEDIINSCKIIFKVLIDNDMDEVAEKYKDRAKNILHGNKLENEKPLMSDKAMLETTREYKRCCINKRRDKELTNANITYKNVEYDSDEKSINTLQSLAEAVSSNETVELIAKDNTIQKLKGSDVKKISGLCTMHKSKCACRARKIKNDIEAAKTIEEVESIEWDNEKYNE